MADLLTELDDIIFIKWPPKVQKNIGIIPILCREEGTFEKEDGGRISFSKWG